MCIGCGCSSFNWANNLFLQCYACYRKRTYIDGLAQQLRQLDRQESAWSITKRKNDTATKSGQRVFASVMSRSLSPRRTLFASGVELTNELMEPRNCSLITTKTTTTTFLLLGCLFVGLSVHAPEQTWISNSYVSAKYFLMLAKIKDDVKNSHWNYMKTSFLWQFLFRTNSVHLFRFIGLLYIFLIELVGK